MKDNGKDLIGTVFSRGSGILYEIISREASTTPYGQRIYIIALGGGNKGQESRHLVKDVRRNFKTGYWEIKSSPTKKPKQRISKDADDLIGKKFLNNNLSVVIRDSTNYDFDVRICYIESAAKDWDVSILSIRSWIEDGTLIPIDEDLIMTGNEAFIGRCFTVNKSLKGKVTGIRNQRYHVEWLKGSGSSDWRFDELEGKFKDEKWVWEEKVEEPKEVLFKINDIVEVTDGGYSYSGQPSLARQLNADKYKGNSLRKGNRGKILSVSVRQNSNNIIVVVLVKDEHYLISTDGIKLLKTCSIAIQKGDWFERAEKNVGADNSVKNFRYGEKFLCTNTEPYSNSQNSDVKWVHASNSNGTQDFHLSGNFRKCEPPTEVANPTNLQSTTNSANAVRLTHPSKGEPVMASVDFGLGTYKTPSFGTREEILTNKKEKIMNNSKTTIAVEVSTKAFATVPAFNTIYGSPAADLGEYELFAALQQIDGELTVLKDLKTGKDSSRITKQVKALKEARTNVITAIDALPEDEDE